MNDVDHNDRSPDRDIRVDPVERWSDGATYVTMPLLLAFVVIFGGLRFSSAGSELVFVFPPLFTLILSAVTIFNFARSGILDLGRWSGSGTNFIDRAANLSVLILLFLAITQTYNSVLPERWIALWIVGIFVLWSIWTSILAGSDARRSAVGFVSTIGMAFVVKYLLLAGVTGSSEGSFIERWWNEPGKQATTWFLDLPRYAEATGYLQFFVVIAMGAALYLFPDRPTAIVNTTTDLIGDRHRDQFPIPSDSNATESESITVFTSSGDR